MTRLRLGSYLFVQVLISNNYSFNTYIIQDY